MRNYCGVIVTDRVDFVDFKIIGIIRVILALVPGEEPPAAIGSFLVYGLSSLVDVVLAYGWMRSGQRMVYDLAGDLYGKLQRRSLRR